MLVFIAVVLLLLAAVGAKTIRMPDVPTEGGAGLMAFAIFAQGAGLQMAGEESVGAAGFAVPTLLIWLLLLTAYAGSAIDGSFRKRHWDDPVARFAIGTWVAGTGFALIAAHVRFPQLHPILLPLGILNVGLLIFYLFGASLAAGEIAGLRLQGKLHGVILMTTVALQSVSLMLHELFGAKEYMMYRVLILLGILFYLAGAALLVRRYVRGDRSSADDWPETNAMVYGALAITGAAALRSSVFPAGALIGIWIFALLLLLLVEGIGLVRAGRRIRQHGWAEELGAYAPRGWRLFALGLFFFFAREAGPVLTEHAPHRLVVLHEWTMYVGAWIIIFLFIAQLLVWMLDLIRYSSTGRKHSS